MSQSKDPDPLNPPEGSSGVKIDRSKIEGVVADRISLSGGRNQIIGQLHKTIHVAVNLADHMVSYAARLKGADVRMRDISDRIRATSSILHGIQILFEQLTSEPTKGSLNVPDAVNDLYAELQSCETWFKGVEQQMLEFMEGVPTPKGLEGKERKKVELAQESLVVLEANITAVEFGIQDHKVNLQIRLSIFSLSFSNQEPDLTWSDMISDMLSELRRILRELGMLRNGTEPKTLRSPVLGPSESSQPGRVPAPAAFNPRYAGWVIQRGSKHAPGNNVRNRSWSRPDVTPLAYSSEQLYLQVVSLMVKDGKKNQTLHDKCERLGRKRLSAIQDLLARETRELQNEQPSIKWTLASIQPQMHRIDRYRAKISSMFVILKTELKPHVDWERLKSHQVPHLRGGADREELDLGDGYNLRARRVRPPRHQGRDREYHRERPEETPRIYNTYAGPSHNARQQHQRRNESANPIFAFGSRLAGVLSSARLDARARTYYGKGKGRAHEIRKKDDELIYALVEDWNEVVRVWPRSYLTASYNIAQTAVPRFTHGTSAYGTSGGHRYATTGTYVNATFAAPVHGGTSMPAHHAGDRYTVTAQGSTAAHPADNFDTVSTSTRRTRTGRARRQGRVITLQAIINTSRQRRKEDGGRR